MQAALGQSKQVGDLREFQSVSVCSEQFQDSQDSPSRLNAAPAVRAGVAAVNGYSTTPVDVGHSCHEHSSWRRMVGVKHSDRRDVLPQLTSIILVAAAGPDRRPRNASAPRSMGCVWVQSGSSRRVKSTATWKSWRL